MMPILTGGYTLWQTRKQATGLRQRYEHQRVQSAARLLIMGFTLSLYYVPIGLSTLAIAAIRVGMSLIGLNLGKSSVNGWDREAKSWVTWS